MKEFIIKKPQKCPKCLSSDLLYEKKSEEKFSQVLGEIYGGGVVENWLEIKCNKCGHTWRSKEEYSYS